ncbi:hypothetical protein BH10PLA2_BH10PLA2_31100 [soil metagenome]
MAILAVWTPTVWAHAVGLSCKVVDRQLKVEAYFDDDTPAIEATIVVRNERNEIVAQGKTDERGMWACDRPAAGRYEVSVDVGAGHRAKQQLTVPESPGESETAVTGAGAGPTRDDFTRVPWARLAIGLGLIFIVAAGWRRRANTDRYKASRS